MGLGIQPHPTLPALTTHAPVAVEKLYCLLMPKGREDVSYTKSHKASGEHTDHTMSHCLTPPSGNHGGEDQG